MPVAPRTVDRSLALRSARMATLLRDRGVGAGDCIALAMPDLPEAAVVLGGARRLGATVAPLEATEDAVALATGIERAHARLLIAWQGVAEAAEVAAASTGVAVLFVAPGEFDRLLDHAERT